MIVDGWLDWARRVDGIPDKVYSQPNSGIGIAVHSVVGEESEFEDGIPNRFFDTTRLPNGRYTDAAAASVMFVLRKDGELIQMYDVTKSTWTSGGYEGNTNYWAIEAEGGLYPNYGEQLTPEAEATFIRLVTEWEAYSGLKAEPNVNILQHRQIAAKYGYAPTACASGRYDTAWSRIAAGERYEDTITQEQFDEMFQASMGKLFPAYIEAYYSKGFTARNAVIDPGEVSDPGPIIPPHKHSPKGKKGIPI